MKRATLQSVNKDRFTFMFASLVGKRVTVKLRSLAVFEGMFSGCTVDKGEQIVLLKHARELPSESRLSGPVQEQLLIPGKEVVSMTAVDVIEGEEDHSDVKTEFKTDTEINAKKPASAGRGERQLESWADVQEENHDLELESTSVGWGQADQFAVAKQMGVVSTYKEDLYTTPLDFSRLTSEQRARADQVAREIEGGRNYASQEEGDGGDEEGQFSAVIGTGGYKAVKAAVPPRAHPAHTVSSWRREDDPQRSTTNTRLNALNLEPATIRPVAPPKQAPLPQIPARASGLSAPAPMEMKGINALNLEPASAARAPGWDSAKYARASAKPQPTKRDFEIALAEIKTREQKSTSPPPPPEEYRRQAAKGKGKGGVPGSPKQPLGGFSFNPNASTFTPGGNTLSIAITPGGSLSGTLKGSNYDSYETAPPPSTGLLPAGGPPPPGPPYPPQMMPPPPQMMGQMPPPPMMMFPMMMQPLPPPVFTPLVETVQMEKTSVGALMLAFVARASSGIPVGTWASPTESSNSSSSYKDILGPLPSGMPMMPPPMHPGMMLAPGYGMPYYPPPGGPVPYAQRPPRGYGGGGYRNNAYNYNRHLQQE